MDDQNNTPIISRIYKVADDIWSIQRSLLKLTPIWKWLKLEESDGRRAIVYFCIWFFLAAIFTPVGTAYAIVAFGSYIHRDL